MILSKRPSLLELRDRLGQQKAVQKREFLVCSSIPQGVPRGVICEATGTARTEWMISILAENPKLAVFWVEDRLSILPTALHQRGIDLTRVLMAEAGDKLFQTLRKALRSRLFDCIVLPGVIEQVKMLKALQLFARDSNAAVFFLSKKEKNAWTIPFQIHVDWDSSVRSYTIEILKSKFSHSESI